MGIFPIWQKSFGETLYENKLHYSIFCLHKNICLHLPNKKYCFHFLLVYHSPCPLSPVTDIVDKQTHHLTRHIGSKYIVVKNFGEKNTVENQMHHLNRDIGSKNSFKEFCKNMRLLLLPQTIDKNSLSYAI